MADIAEKLFMSTICSGVLFFLAGLWVVSLGNTALMLMTSGLSLVFVPAAVFSLVSIWREK